MSALKIQRRELLQQLSREANRIQDPTIKKRYYFLKKSLRVKNRSLGPVNH